VVIHLLTLTLASPLSQEEEEAVLDSYESLGYHLRQFGRGEKVRWQKKKVKDGSAEPKRARKRKAAEATPAAAMSLDMSPAAQPHPADGEEGGARLASPGAAQPASMGMSMGMEADSSSAAADGERLGSSYIMLGR
jgi:hypothetical protein|tara:strand:- start:160 stop:567 length:408 start_codon:yes stop_codon:yes gene_type:complete